MTLRLHTFLTGLLALLTAALLALAPAGANPASGGYQLFEPVASEHQADIQLASLKNFDYHAKIVLECCNAPNRTVGGDPIEGLRVIGRGEDLIGSMVLSGAEEAFLFSNEHFPAATEAFVEAMMRAGEGAAVMVNFADKATGQVVSTAWNDLPQDTRDAIIGGGVVVSFVVPAGAATRIARAKPDVAPNATVTEFVDGVTIVDRSTGRTLTGPVDLKDSLTAIDAGPPYAYARDGITFRNREGLLPSQPDGYYSEFTVPTPGALDRGPQRIIVGANGERFYTPDHYQSFVRLDQ